MLETPLTPSNQEARAPHAELAVRLARTPLSAGDLAKAQRTLSPGIDWDGFFATIAAWQIEAVALENLLSLASNSVPESVTEKAALLAREVRATTMSRALVINDLLSLMERAGLRTILLKGPATGVTAYGDASLRSFSDIDLLIRRDDLATARTLLLDHGYSATYELRDETRLVDAGHALELSGRLMKAELHHSLMSHYLRVPFDADETWNRSRPIACAGREVRALDIQTEFVFLCAHGAKHSWASFRWICDVAQLLVMLSSSDAAGIAELASRLHAMKILALGLELTRSTFDVELPIELDTIRRKYSVGPIASAVLERMGVHGDPRPSARWTARLHPAMPQLLFWARSRERLRDRIGSFASLALRR